METASANQAVKIDVKRQSKGPLSYAYNQDAFPPVKPLAQVRPDLTRNMVTDYAAHVAITYGCFGAAAMAILFKALGR
jgi:hypothetical protein